VFFRESKNFDFLERDGDDRVAGSWVLSWICYEHNDS